jgi:hypothetical protein
VQTIDWRCIEISTSRFCFLIINFCEGMFSLWWYGVWTVNASMPGLRHIVMDYWLWWISDVLDILSPQNLIWNMVIWNNKLYTVERWESSPSTFEILMSCKQESYTFGSITKWNYPLASYGLGLGIWNSIDVGAVHASGSWNDKQIDLLPMVLNLKTTVGWNSACEGNQSSSKTVLKSCTILLALSLFFRVIW